MQIILSCRPVVGEAGRFFVQSRTLFCANTHGCKFSYKNSGEAMPKHAAGDPCPKCGHKLEPTDYLVDLTMFAGLGRCACQRWQYHLQPLIGKMTGVERLMVRESEEYICSHIKAARVFFCMEQLDNLNRFNLGTRLSGGREQEGE